MRTNMKRYLLAKHRKESDNEKHEIMSSSTDIASHDDVLMEILLRLPIRSLLRSKCVSKQWRAAISDHRFSLFRNPNVNPPCGLFLQRINGNVKEYDFVSLDTENDFKPPFKTLNFDGYEDSVGFMVLHSCKGLMLCHRLHEYYCKVSKEIVYNAMYYVYNPTINQVVTLPKFQGKGCEWAQRRPRGLTLAFDPLKSPYYKVICVGGYLWSDHLYDIGIYSSETKSWRSFAKPFSNHIDTEFTGGVYWNNAVHWINKKGFVLYLKIDEGSLDQISIPVRRDGWNVKRHCYPLVESRDCLLFIDSYPQLSMQFDVYEMDRDYSGWSVKYHVDLNQMTTKFPESTDTTRCTYGVVRPPQQSFVIHCLVLGEREEDSFIVVEIPGKAIRYNIVLKTYQQLCELHLCRPSRLSVADDGFSKLGRWPGAFLFVESLSYV